MIKKISRGLFLSAAAFTVLSVPSFAENSSAGACNPQVLVKSYRVYSLKDDCGNPIRNTFIAGAINRASVCRPEELLGRVFACTRTCGNCASRSKAAEIACTTNCNSCSNGEYIDALIKDLGSDSHRIRHAAVRELRHCGNRVEIGEECRKDLTRLPDVWLKSAQAAVPTPTPAPTPATPVAPPQYQTVPARQNAKPAPIPAPTPAQPPAPETEVSDAVPPAPVK